MKFFAHFKTITTHKLLVMKYCFRVGLYWQGLMHDMSKYMPSEFLRGARFYRGVESPNNEERRRTGVSLAWLHHKGRNKHHFEYWIDYSPTGEQTITGMKMPLKYVAEMICDRIAASRIYLGERYTPASSWEYYERSRHRVIMHPETQALLEQLLQMIKDDGEDKALLYIKKQLLHH